MVRRERPRLVRMATRLLGSGHDAEDVAQTALLKLWTLRTEMDDIDRVEAYATMMVRNLCLDKLKSVGMRNGTSIDELQQWSSGEPTPHDRLEQSESVTQVERIMSSLPDAQQAVMKMRHVDGLEISEIAHIMDINEGNVRVMLSRGRQRVKELFLRMQK